MSKVVKNKTSEYKGPRTGLTQSAKAGLNEEIIAARKRWAKPENKKRRARNKASKSDASYSPGERQKPRTGLGGQGITRGWLPLLTRGFSKRGK
jgi:hypothetical protein|tara:strand:- start:1377 stop:1658 length:282 start_codon:yes stop_codon:yes gene_type:complete